MRKYMLMMSLVFFCLLIACQSGGVFDKDKIDVSRFKNPHKEDRATLFYSLNDSLKPDLIRRQISDFAKSGVGGVFLHARDGLLTQYFGEDWWDAIDAAVDQCVQSGIDPWFYDEYKWPSGYAAGYVPAQSKEFRGRYLARIAKREPVPEDGSVVSEDENYNYVCMTAEYGNPWLNGACKIDYLNPEAVKTFIDHTYKTYADRNKKRYNSAGKGIFFDEPDIRPAAGRKKYDGIIAYSPAFREEFQKEKGYDIADRFACLFEETGKYRKVRLDYWQMMAAQYEKAFAGQLGTFCEANNLVLTGHFFPEENLSGNKSGIGNLMRQVRNEGMPGMDHLELRIDGALNAAKSISSVGNQYGKERRMSELFGVSGQNMSFEDRQWIANWHAVLGINFFVEHLALYSMKGERKRDYPPALSNQQPWWGKNKQVEDYMGRLCYLSTLGKFDASTLLLVPIESEYIANDIESKKLFNNYYSAMENLMGIHCDFDLGDEQIIEEIGTPEDSLFKVGEMKYRYVVVPELLTLRESTIYKLLEFSKQGGKLIILGNYPKYIDAEPSHLLEQLKEFSILLSNKKEDLVRYLPAGLAIAHRPEAQIYTQKRILPKGELFFITNLSRTTHEDVIISFHHKPKHLTLWNPADGRSYAVELNGDNEVKLRIELARFYILSTGDSYIGEHSSEKYTFPSDTNPICTINKLWSGGKLSPNAITLDYARYSLDNGNSYSDPEPVIGIMRRLSSENYHGPLRLHYEVQLEDSLTNVGLVVESPSMYRAIQVNGENVTGFHENNYFLDYFFKKSGNIASHLKVGKNIITFAVDYKSPDITNPVFSERYGTEIESIYLIGDFAVRARDAVWNVWDTEKNQSSFYMKKPVHRMNGFFLTKEDNAYSDDLVMSGYPFYAGSFEMNNSFEMQDVDKNKRYYVHIPLAEAIVYELSINGLKLDALTAYPFKWDITSYLQEGENQISFTLCNSLRNLLGPHHHVGGELKGTSPFSFTGTGGWPHSSGDWDWYDLRVHKGASLKIWMDDYNLIPFGFIQPIEISESI